MGEGLDTTLASYVEADLGVQHEAHQAAKLRGEDVAEVHSWPRYEWVLNPHRATRRYRLHDRGTRPAAQDTTAPSAHHQFSPPCDEWVSTVIADWLELLYHEVRAPLEPLLGCIRAAVLHDAKRDIPEADAAAAPSRDTPTIALDARYSSGLRLPRLADEVLVLLERTFPSEVASVYRPVVRRMGDYYAQSNPLRRLVCDSWLWCWFAKPQTVFPLALECFVEQGSPCCAAASSSGALNMILRRPRRGYVEYPGRHVGAVASNPDAAPPFSSQDALSAMQDHLVDMTMKSAENAGVLISERHVKSMSDDIAAMLSPGGALYFAPPTTKQQQRVCLQGIRDHIVGLNLRDSHLFVNLRWNEDGSRPKCKASTKTLYVFLSNMWGLGKIKARNPSTARFGSWGVQMAIEKISNAGALGINCATQNAADYTRSEFKQLLHKPMTAVVLHLPNHYAVVFGLKDDDTIITARKGQPPTDLVTWGELQQVQARSSEGSIIVAYHSSSPLALKYSNKSSFSYFGPSAARTKSDVVSARGAAPRKGSTGSILPSVRPAARAKKANSTGSVKVATLHF